MPVSAYYRCSDLNCRACYKESDTLANQKRTAKPSERAAIPESTVPHITDYPDLVDILPDLCTEHRSLSLQIAPLEERKRELGEEIKSLLDAVEAKSIRGAGWVVTRSADGFTESIKPEKLLSAGVTMAQIEAGTVQTPRKGYVQVKAGGE